MKTSQETPPHPHANGFSFQTSAITNIDWAEAGPKHKKPAARRGVGWKACWLLAVLLAAATYSLAWRALRCHKEAPAAPLPLSHWELSDSQLLLELHRRDDPSEAEVAGAARAPQRGALPGAWGCAAPNGQRFHIVIASAAGSPRAWLPWVRALGLSNADVFLYVRRPEAALLDACRAPLPCGMKLHVKSHMPNIGSKASVYMAHILAHLDDLPEAVMMVHEHGGGAWHSLCGPFLRRARAFYLGMDPASPDEQLRRFAQQMVTLSSGCMWGNQTCTDRLFCGHCKGLQGGADTHRCEDGQRFAGEEVNLTRAGYSLHLQFNFSDPGWGRAEEEVLERWGAALEAATREHHAAAQGREEAGPVPEPSSDERVFNDQICPAAVAGWRHKALPLPPELLAGAAGGARGARGAAGAAAPHQQQQQQRFPLHSCCSHFIVPRWRLRLRPREAYQAMHDLAINASWTSYLTGQCLEYSAFPLWNPWGSTEEEVALYPYVDRVLGHMCGCPVPPDDLQRA